MQPPNGPATARSLVRPRHPRRQPCRTLRRQRLRPIEQTASIMTDSQQKPVARPPVGPREPLPRSFKPLWRLMLALAVLVALVAGAAYIVDSIVYQ